MGAYKCVCLLSTHTPTPLKIWGLGILGRVVWRVGEELVKSWWRVFEEFVKSWWRVGEELVAFKITFVLEAGVLLHFHSASSSLSQSSSPMLMVRSLLEHAHVPTTQQTPIATHQKVHFIFGYTSSQPSSNKIATREWARVWHGVC